MTVNKHPDGYVVAVLGATGLVGSTMIATLESRHFPVARLVPLATHAGGRSVTFRGENIPVERASADAFAGVDLALFSAGGEASTTFAPEAARRGCVVIDNSSAWRMDPIVPLVVSQVNPGDLAAHHGIIANPNCSTMQLAPILAALRDAVGIKRVVVSTYQAVSGAGGKAVKDLVAQRQALVNGETVRSSMYPHAVALSPLPAIGEFLPNGSTVEERKLVQESRKILGLPELRLTATAVRVPVETSHSEAVSVELAADLSPAEARALFARIPGVTVVDDPETHAYPLAGPSTGSDEIFVGRIRVDESVEHGLDLWIVSDNVRKGAATNAVEIAEILVRDGLLLPGAQPS
jgi:aspartate-semialdehyde dehydrogenase